MEREARIAWLVDHYRRPRHRGPLPDADARLPGGNPGCGDVITLYLKAERSEDRVAAVSFEGVGCTLSQAAASILAERTNRRKPTFEEVLAFSYEEVMDLLGRDIAASRPRCATLALGTLKAAVKTVEMNRKLRAAGHTDAEIRELRRAVAAQAEETGLVLGEGAEQAALAGAAPLPDILVGS
ncbi:MAG: iron-sulfur cluster assembly scaffold protein [Actinomycetota bacterium]